MPVQHISARVSKLVSLMQRMGYPGLMILFNAENGVPGLDDPFG